MLRPSKLYTRFLRQLLPLLALAFALAAAVTAALEYSRQWHTAQTQRQETLAAFGQALLKPLWDCDTVTAQGVAYAIAQQSNVVGVEIEHLCPRKVLHAGQALHSGTDLRHLPLFHVDEHQRTHPLGELRIAFRPLSATATAAASLWQPLIIFAAMLLTVVTCTAWVFKRIIGQPLLQLVQAIRQHQELAPLPTQWAEELTEVSQAYNLQVRALREQALHDPLTGLANRVLLFEHLQQAIRRALRARTTGYVLMLDLNGFKAINDTLGHAAGDQALRLLAQRLREGLRETDIIARLGGDEFAIVTMDTDPPPAIDALALRIHQMVEQPITALAPVGLHLSTSIGWVQFPRDGTDCDSLLEGADRAMYRAKRERAGVSDMGATS